MTAVMGRENDHRVATWRSRAQQARPARWGRAWVVALVVTGLACGEGGPGTSGASESGTGAASTAGEGTSGSDGSETQWMPPDPDGSDGPPMPSQTASCASWVACAGALQERDAEAIEQMYGSDGACWAGDAAQAAACAGACEDELAAAVMELEAMGQAVPEACDPPRNVSWSEIDGILAAHCVEGCHEPGGVDSSLDLSDGAYYAIYGVASDQSQLYLVDAGSKEESYLWHKVSGSQGSVGGSGSRMPQGVRPLTTEQIDAIGDWIDNGAQNF